MKKTISTFFLGLVFIALTTFNSAAALATWGNGVSATKDVNVLSITPTGTGSFSVTGSGNSSGSYSFQIQLNPNVAANSVIFSFTFNVSGLSGNNTVGLTWTTAGGNATSTFGNGVGQTSGPISEGNISLNGAATYIISYTVPNKATLTFTSINVDGVLTGSGVVPEPTSIALAFAGLIFTGTATRKFYLNRQNKAKF